MVSVMFMCILFYYSHITEPLTIRSVDIRYKQLMNSTMGCLYSVDLVANTNKETKLKLNLEFGITSSLRHDKRRKIRPDTVY